jgi:hypothetical protein
MSTVSDEVLAMQARLEADQRAIEDARTEAAQAARAERRRLLDVWRVPRGRDAEPIAATVATWEELCGATARARTKLWLRRAIRAREKGQGDVLSEWVWRERHRDWVQLPEVVKQVQHALDTLERLEDIPGPVEAAGIDRAIAAAATWAGTLALKWTELVQGDVDATAAWETFTATAIGAKIAEDEAAHG